MGTPIGVGPPHPALSRVRTAVRRFLAERDGPPLVVVACSGGADSLALVAGAVHAGCAVRALVVDHRLQPDSGAVAATAADTARKLGCVDAVVLPVTVQGPGGPEAAARDARYAALLANAPTGAPVLLGHTLDDQAETVLLGLGRGSGPRAIAGMRGWDPPWGRPLLEVPRADTEAACAALGVRPWRDPHNSDPRYRRVRVRTEALPMLEDVLSGGVAAALARTAAAVREDMEVLDGLASLLWEHARSTADPDESDEAPHSLAVFSLTDQPAAIRRRVLHRWLSAHGIGALTDLQLRTVDRLLGRWRGQGGVTLSGGFVVRRAHGRLVLDRPPLPPPAAPR